MTQHSTSLLVARNRCLLVPFYWIGGRAHFKLALHIYSHTKMFKRANPIETVMFHE